MPSLSKLKNEAANQISEAEEKPPALYIYGRSTHTKNFTIKSYNEIVSKYGLITDFKSNKKYGLKFFISVAEMKFLLMIKQLKNANCLLIENTTDNRAKAKSNAEDLSLIIQVKVI